MKSLIALLFISLCVGASAEAQKRKRAPSRSNGQPAGPTNNKPRILGSIVVITTKNGDRITGELLDLTAYSARIKADNLESSIALDTVASISFDGAAANAAPANQPIAPLRADFAREAQPALGIFQTLASSLKPGVDYTEYGHQLSELRRASDRFIMKYSTTDNAGEAHVVSLLAGALTDYTWARTIWTLKFGRSNDGTVAETDSPVVADALALYPDLHGQAAAGNRLSVEKLVVGLWGKASEKTSRARSLIAPAR
jgi:hypothetical protein